MRPQSTSRALACFVLIAAVTGGCETKSTVSTVPTTPASVKCQLDVTTPSMVDASGGSGTVKVTTEPECAWNASTSANWITAITPTTGQGTGDVSFRVAANDGSSARDGEIVINDSHIRVSQRAPCRYEVGPPSQSMGAGGGSGRVSVSVNSDCAWTATSDVSWITLAAPVSGSGNGTVNFTVAPNSGADRTGNVVIAGQRSMITQSAVATSCSYTIAPTSQNVAATGGTGTPVMVTTTSACRWTASSNASWITITSGATGTGNASVGFTVAANTGAARTGTLTIATRAFTVNQAAAGAPPPPPPPSCSYSISPGTTKIGRPGGAGAITVSASSGCTWTASSNDSWITVTTGASGSGNGSVTFLVAPNLGKDRKGTLTVAGKNATVEQKGD